MSDEVMEEKFSHLTASLKEIKDEVVGLRDQVTALHVGQQVLKTKLALYAAGISGAVSVGVAIAIKLAG